MMKRIPRRSQTHRNLHEGVCPPRKPSDDEMLSREKWSAVFTTRRAFCSSEDTPRGRTIYSEEENFFLCRVRIEASVNRACDRYLATQGLVSILKLVHDRRHSQGEEVHYLQTMIAAWPPMPLSAFSNFKFTDIAIFRNLS